MNKQLTVIDFFCGCGGFSEGFRQQGFKIVQGIDNWAPCVVTHNMNHGLEDKPTDVLRYEDCKTDLIDKDLENTDIIVGSPPCVSFSMSNKAGKADKSLGIRLIEAYLRIVAYKKFKKGSILKAWLLENVPNSRNFVREEYTFKDLNLSEFARSIGKKEIEVALRLKNNGNYLIAADYGSPQKRKRFVGGEIVKTGEFPEPQITHSSNGEGGKLKYVTLGKILGIMPSPAEPKEDGIKHFDPNYSILELTQEEITDHFYDTGVYESEWRDARSLKVNHSFMGKMSFPENEAVPSRTIMATRSASTREAIIYKSAFPTRKGNGEYRLPTIREISSLMGFPYTYQFYGSEGSKWKQIGNAVCTHLSNALAKTILEKLGLKSKSLEELKFPKVMELPDGFEDLNTFKAKLFNKPPRRKPTSKFRDHMFKEGNLTIELMNFNPKINAQKILDLNGEKWYGVIYLGAGKTYDIVLIEDSLSQYIKNKLQEDESLLGLMSRISNFVIKCVPDSKKFQNLYCLNEVDGVFLNPGLLLEKIKELINQNQRLNYNLDIEIPEINKKSNIPVKQALSIFAISEIVNQTESFTEEKSKMNNQIDYNLEKMEAV